MSTAAPSVDARSLPREQLQSAAVAGVPWTIWAGVVAVTSASIGGAWDVAWHRSIGRDSFLTPAHVAIYMCGIIAAVVCGYLIFATTFGGSQAMKDRAVTVLGFRAPLGAFIAAWGGIAMLASAPFDNWWHNAYGLDVKIISPPHVLLILGVRSVSIGVLFLILAAMNRAETAENGQKGTIHRSLERIFLYLGGIMLFGQMFFLLEVTWEGALHSVSAYIAMAIAIPVNLALFHRSTRHLWAGTITAVIFTTLAIAEILIFPLFPATPKLGPVYFPVTHLVPTKFPILLIAPAVALDLLFRFARRWKTWQIALIAGALFTAVLVAVEWPFAGFLLSKASENRFFGTIYFDFSSRPDGPDRLRQFYDPSHGAALVKGLLIASGCAAASTWVGLRFGAWMRGVQR